MVRVVVAGETEGRDVVVEGTVDELEIVSEDVMGGLGGGCGALGEGVRC